MCKRQSEGLGKSRAWSMAGRQSADPSGMICTAASVPDGSVGPVLVCERCHIQFVTTGSPLGHCAVE